MEPSFSIQYDVTLKQAIMDFYKMKEYQLLKPEHLDTVDDSVIEKRFLKFYKPFHNPVRTRSMSSAIGRNSAIRIALFLHDFWET
ncbi:hypothetical protein NBRC111894_3183 [Sporolactobacillus inulinus]|uniref:Uncharacterized protein n=1 Tax=Sporolactobacillus inulinus TaxID=2078 RepID=A0A4Y1ZF32_9BACL|nr:hypothetical protein NBRC111894_3183 [Sporolactobacillus inulinus]